MYDKYCPDSIVHGANMGPTWVLSAPDGPHIGPINLAIRVESPGTECSPVSTWLIIICQCSECNSCKGSKVDHDLMALHCICIWSHSWSGDLLPITILFPQHWQPFSAAMHSIGAGNITEMCQWSSSQTRLAHFIRMSVSLVYRDFMAAVQATLMASNMYW